MNRPSINKDLTWLRQISSFMASRIILTANNYRIFDYLEKKGLTAKALADVIKTDPRATVLLLNSLVAIGLLRKKKDIYTNEAVTSKYLVSGKCNYQGDILRHYSNLWESWSGLDNVLKTGRPNRRPRDLESFILGMHNLAVQKVKKVINNIDLKGVRRLLDLGGGPGTYSMAFAKKKIDVTLMDYTETLEIAKKLINESGMTERIRLLPGDFTVDDIGNNYDLIFISQILHAYDEETCMSILQKSYDALNPGGKIIIQEFYLDENKTFPFQGAVFAINMLVNTDGGRSYTLNEITSWMKKIGLKNISSTLINDSILISGIK